MAAPLAHTTHAGELPAVRIAQAGCRLEFADAYSKVLLLERFLAESNSMTSAGALTQPSSHDVVYTWGALQGPSEKKDQERV